VARTRTPKDAARAFAIEAARLAEDRRCTDVVVLDLRGISPVTDYFVICTGTSDRQMRSVADEMIDLGAAGDYPVYSTAGMDRPEWVLLDFVDLVVHLFDEEHRHYYDLELIWGDAPHVRWRRRKSRAVSDSKDAT
jgi:ribosome-associated protein